MCIGLTVYIVKLKSKNKKLHKLVKNYKAEVGYLYRRSNLVNCTMLSEKDRLNLDTSYPDLKKYNDERCDTYESIYNDGASFRHVGNENMKSGTLVASKNIKVCMKLEDPIETLQIFENT
tara:strand:+ start:392 stop:751 length:360 start_codon:yes stop_codon:yes gene_type:complete